MFLLNFRYQAEQRVSKGQTLRLVKPSINKKRSAVML